MTGTVALRDQIALSLKTVCWLCTNGFVPLSQRAGCAGKPIITIAHSGKCALLHRRYGSEVIQKGVNELGCFKNWQADVNGCLVEWVELA